jgi:serine/threonine protein kinase
MRDDDKTRILPDMANTAVGTQLSGIYELDERIASGGMGEVYRGHNIQTGDHVAIKIVLPEFARDQTILSLFRKEASILNHLSHDAIVRYHVFTIDPGIGRPYLAMEFVDGQSLFDVMRRGPMPAGDVRKLCHRLASGLSFVHEAGAVHRDLSPDNIILPGGKVERAKIIDFGIARSATVGGETLIGGRFAGKYNYVSPEQLGLFGGEVSERSDIYSLGLVLAAVLRGKPLDMSGSQFEIVEKRRIVPDLSDIADDFRPILEEMLQPNPLDRPTGAEIARMTRDEVDDDGTSAPRSALSRDRSTVRPGQSASADPWVETRAPVTQGVASPQPPNTPKEPHFVPHMPPVRLAQPRPAATKPAPAAAPARSANTRNIAVAAAVVVVALGGGAYLGGFLTPPPASDIGETPPLKPNVSTPPKPDNAPTESQPAENPVQPQTETSTEKMPVPAIPSDAEKKEQPAQTDNAASDQTPVPETSPPAENPLQPQTETSAERIPVPAIPPDAEEKEEPAPTDNTAGDQTPVPETSPPSANQQDTAGGLPQQPDTITENTTGPSATGANTPPRDQQAVTDGENKDSSETTNGSANSDAETESPIQSVSPPTVANDKEPAIEQPANDGEDETEIAIQIPKPELPATPKPEIPTIPEIPATIGEVAKRISWLRDYSGGDCFYAAATSATDKAIDIEVFGTKEQPVEDLLTAFQAQFNLEPEIGFRPIEPAQCEVTGFLRTLAATGAEKPQLTLDRTSIPNGSPVSGTLETSGGLRSNLLLIDHKGMVFNLDERLVVQPGKATFSIPIGLGAADMATGKAVPQIILAVTGGDDIASATFSTPIPASIAFPRILDEIREKGLEFSATAKYFQLGG